MTGNPQEKHTIRSRLQQFGALVATRLVPQFEQAGVKFPPVAISLLVFKDCQQVQLYAKHQQGAWTKVRTFDLQGFSGCLGPKLQEGDKQIPEGIYHIELLNPNSRFHVALRLNYPNSFDLRMAQVDARTNLGGDIMIHGSDQSIGCLAVGDSIAEELFALASWIGKDNIKVVISPTDFRYAEEITIDQELPDWVPLLYQELKSELNHYE